MLADLLLETLLKIVTNSAENNMHHLPLIHVGLLQPRLFLLELCHFFMNLWMRPEQQFSKLN